MRGELEPQKDGKDSCIHLSVLRLARINLNLQHFQERYQVLLNKVGIKGPTRAEFKLADLDGDGILLLKEWRIWVALQK